MQKNIYRKGEMLSVAEFALKFHLDKPVEFWLYSERQVSSIKQRNIDFVYIESNEGHDIDKGNFCFSSNLLSCQALNPLFSRG